MHNIGLSTHKFEQIRENIFKDIPAQPWFIYTMFPFALLYIYNIHLYIVFYPTNVYIKSYWQFKLHIPYANIELLDLRFDNLPYRF